VKRAGAEEVEGDVGVSRGEGAGVREKGVVGRRAKLMYNLKHRKQLEEETSTGAGRGWVM